MPFPEPPKGPSELVRIYDDRADSLDAVMIAVLSIRRHEPDLRISVSLGDASPSTVQWLANLPGVTLSVGEDFGARGWDVKPELLLTRLRQHDGPVLWWDTDVVASGPFRHLFTEHTEEVLVCTEDTFWGQEQGGVQRTVAWGLTPGRSLPATLNTGLLRIGAAHRPLLDPGVRRSRSQATRRRSR